MDGKYPSGSRSLPGWEARMRNESRPFPIPGALLNAPGIGKAGLRK